MSSSNLQTASSALFKIAAASTVLANIGRILSNVVQSPPYEKRNEKTGNWLGYKANLWTAMACFRQGYFYYFAMGIFYFHLSQKKGKLSAMELLGLINQIIFHLHSVYDFRGLSQKVSALFAFLVGGGAACHYYSH